MELGTPQPPPPEGRGDIMTHFGKSAVLRRRKSFRIGPLAVSSL